MKKIIIKIVSFFSKDHMPKYIVVSISFLVAFAVLLYLAATDVVSNVFGTVTGFLLSSMFLYSCKIVVGRLEDMLKINYDTEALLALYSGGSDYRKAIRSGDTQVEFAYADVLINKDYTFHVVDNPGKTLELDEFIAGNYQTIFQAHSNSAKKNFDTIRLDHFDPQTNTFYLSRSTYFNHLVTNRAIDFQIFDDVSLRTIYEYGPRLNTLENSKMSNHIGINAVVFLSDGRLLVPRRGNSSTISKNKVTSSIAVMLNFPDEYKNDVKNVEISTDYLLRGNIMKNLSDRVKLPKGAVAEDEVEIKFLGFGQNIYEGGKPQFYFSVELKNIDTATYFAKREEYLEEQKRSNKEEIIDVDKCMYVADYSSYRYEKSFVKFKAYTESNKPFAVKCGYEMSYLCNLWHYEKTKKAARAALVAEKI